MYNEIDSFFYFFMQVDFGKEQFHIFIFSAETRLMQAAGKGFLSSKKWPKGSGVSYADNTEG